jgi:Zn-dependent protease
MRNPVEFAIVAGILLYSIIAHELAHGITAFFFGDSTAKNYGRLTLNPMNHLDPIGTLMLFIVGFGWAKPVPVDYGKLRNSRIGLIAVSLAGVCANILIAIVALAVSMSFAARPGSGIYEALHFVARINIILGAFNLIPIPPLDGSKVVMGLLPFSMQEKLMRIEPYGMFILVFFLFTGMLNSIIAFMQNALYALIGLLLGASM